MSKARAYHLKRLYGITLEQYDQLLEKQNHSCAICKRHESEFKTRLAVDHDHKTGEIFGLLCMYCNHRLIGKERRPELFENASKYLCQGTGWFVPEKPKKKKKPLRKKVPKI